MKGLEAYRQYWEGKISSADIEHFFSSFKDFKSRRTIRVNTLKASAAFMTDWLTSQGYSVKATPESPDGLELEGSGEPLALKVPYYCGYTYPQDAASMFAVEVLNPQPGERVIDLTAAPGGKSTHIAQKMQNTGVLFSNDMDTKRIQALRSNLERLGVWNAVVTRARPHDLSLWYPESFDKVLIDPSCSGEGLFCTPGGQPEFWSEKNLIRYTRDQYSLLVSAFRLLKPGGRLVYSTCTLNLEEDDGVVKRLLGAYPQAEILEVKGAPRQLGDFLGVRFWPHLTGTKGFFCIVLGKKDSLGLMSEHARPFERLRRASSKSMKELRARLEDFSLTVEGLWPELEFAEYDDQIFTVSPELFHAQLPSRFNLTYPVLERLSMSARLSESAGLVLAQHVGQRIALDPSQVSELFEKKTLSIELPFQEGWGGVTYLDFSLGVVKSIQGKGLFKPAHWN